MIYKDRIYGKIKIDEPVVLELIKTPSTQRLKGVDQAGYHKLWVKPNTKMGKYDNSRFAHSIGVYILLRKYNAPFDEQIAGLIHDVSHSAFSHSIDYVLDGGSEKEHNHQDKVFKDFIKNSEIPAILRKYNLEVDYILNEHNFPLLEKSLPDLCADRIDYSLRTAVIFNEISQKDVAYFLNNLIIEGNRWVFKNLESAKRYAELFLMLNRVYYAGLTSAVMFKTIGECLRYAIEKEYLTEEDLYKTDKEVLKKIKRHLKKDEKLNLLFRRMNNQIEVINNPENFDSRVFCKSRIVDPLCYYNNSLLRLSEINPNWKEIIKTELQPKEYFFKFEE